MGFFYFSIFKVYRRSRNDIKYKINIVVYLNFVNEL